MPIPLFGHVGDGNFHCEILIRPGDEADLEEAKAFKRARREPRARHGGHLHRRARHRVRQDGSLHKELGEAVDLMATLKRAIDRKT